MNERNNEIKAQYHQKQRQGMQDLRFMLLLLSLGLIVYTALSFYLLYSIQERDLYLTSFLLYEGGSFIAWCISIRMLWSFNRLGRVVFLLCCIGSVYLYRDAMQLLAVQMHPETYKYVFIVLFVFKCVGLLYCAYRLMVGKSIHYIWNVDMIFDEDLELLEAPSEDEEKIFKRIEPSVLKARKILRRASIRLSIVLYFSMILILLALHLLQSSVPSLSEGIGVIQYALFSECLFSIMLWSGPVIALYIGKMWSPYVLFAAIAGEILRVAISYQNYINIFYNEGISIEVKVLYIIIEILRYVLLILACRRIWHSRLIKQYSRIKHAGKVKNE